MKKILHFSLAQFIIIQAVFSATLLEINVYDPSRVVITATSNGSSITDSSEMMGDGVSLLGFFSNSVALDEENPFFSDLSVAQSTVGRFTHYGTVGVSTLNNGDVDLNFYVSPDQSDTQAASTEIQNYITGQTAFSGSMTIDLSAYSSFFPTVGFFGDIVAGDFGDSGTYTGTIGQYLVISNIPEPSAYALGFGGLVLVSVLCRRRDRSSYLN